MDISNETNVHENEYKVYILMAFSDLKQMPSGELTTLLGNLGITKLSTAETINVLKYPKEPNSYVIAFNVREVIDINANTLVSNIKAVFDANLPTAAVNFIIGAIPLPQDIVGKHAIDECEYVLTLHNIFTSLLANMPNRNYETSDAVTKLAQRLRMLMAAYDDDEEEEEHDDIYEDDTDSFTDSFTDFLTSDNGSGHKKKKKKKHYQMSKVIKAADSPKRSYKRHGVIVCRKNDAIKRDRKIIKDFLKDFIPGNSKWKKHLRSDLADRWIRVYVITKKQLKNIEKSRQKAAERDRLSRSTRQTIDFTRKIFNTPLDKWNDPTK